ncbi:MAG: hypothetical protein ACHQ50_04880 [Fimbriimonadales bacterium]
MLLADSTVDILNIVAPMVVAGLFVLAIILSVFMKHQRKMVELLNPRTPAPDSLLEEVRGMRAEIQRLEAKVEALSGPRPPEPLANRLSDRTPADLNIRS